MLNWKHGTYWLVALLFLTACSSSKKGSDLIETRAFSLVEVIETDPPSGATDVPIDKIITLTLSNKVDAYSSIEENFQFWTVDGSYFGAPKLISTRFVDHPTKPGVQVSQISIALNRNVFARNTTYTMFWAEPPSADGSNLDQFNSSEIDPYALGIMTTEGGILPSGGIEFTTGTTRERAFAGNFAVESMTPGRIIVRGSDIDYTGSFADAINPRTTNSFIAIDKNQPILIHFKQPIGYLRDVDPIDASDENLTEIPLTPIDDFAGYLGIFLVDSETPLRQAWASVAELDFDEWQGFIRNLRGRLDGSVFSINGRRTLVFRLNDNCNDTTKVCSYPDTLAQAVVVVVRGLIARYTGDKLDDDPTIGTFIHNSGFAAKLPFISSFQNPLLRTPSDAGDIGGQTYYGGPVE